MNKLLLALAVIIMTSVCGFAGELKVLMIGNSFTHSVLTYLPSLVKASAEDKLLLGQAEIPGCPIWRHIEEYEKSEADPSHRPYWTNLELKGNTPDGMSSLQELLDAEQWDIVTIQQASHESWQPDKFDNFYPRLVEIIRKHCPKSEIVIQQTWSYASDDPRVAKPSPTWGFDQDEMYRRLNENYRNMAKALNARIIPTGYAVQLSRERAPEKYTGFDKAEVSRYVHPDLPPASPIEVVGSFCWHKDSKTGKFVMWQDTFHLNKRGEYMQACVWYMFLFGRTGADIRFVPESITKEDSAFLIGCAESAVRDYPQVRNLKE